MLDERKVPLSKKPHVQKIRKRKMNQFLKAYSELGVLSKAAEVAGIKLRQHYYWLQAFPEYAEEFEEAAQKALGRLEEEAIRRAVDGVEKPVFYKGQKVGTTKDYSDTLLMFMLKGMSPEKYRDRYEPAQNNTINIQLTALSDEELDNRLNKILSKLNSRGITETIDVEAFEVQEDEVE